MSADEIAVAARYASCAWPTAYYARSAALASSVVNVFGSAGIVVEVGVGWGFHMAALLALRHSNSTTRVKRYIGIDPYVANYGPDSFLHEVDATLSGATAQDRMDALHSVVSAQAATYGGAPARAQIWRTTSSSLLSSSYAASVPAAFSIDYVFIDGAHDYASVLADLTFWWPRVRVGGILAGDDWTYAAVRSAAEAFGAATPLYQGYAGPPFLSSPNVYTDPASGYQTYSWTKQGE